MPWRSKAQGPMQASPIPTLLPSNRHVFAKASDSPHQGSCRPIVQGRPRDSQRHPVEPCWERLLDAKHHLFPTGTRVDCHGLTVSASALPLNLTVSATVSVAMVQGLGRCLGRPFRVAPSPFRGHALYQQVFINKIQNGMDPSGKRTECSCTS